MSTIAAPRPSKTDSVGEPRRGASKTLLGTEPRVQLLPPSVRERERARGAMRLGVLFVVLGVVVAGGLVALGLLRQVSADFAMQEANARTAALFAERARYAEATQVSTTIDGVLETEKSMTSYEIDLADLLGALQARLGEGMSIRELGVEVQAPWGVPLAGEDVLSPPRIANIQIAVTSSSIAQGTAFREALQNLPGFASAVILDAAVGTDGVVTTHISLALATGAVSGRFVEDEESDGATVDGTEQTGGDEVTADETEK
jgi:hypothetical protein